MPTLAMVGTFIFYAKSLPEDEVLDPALIFMAVSLFEFLNEAMAAMPQAVSFCRQVLVSVDRIEEYLLVPEDFVPLKITEGKEGGGVTITDGNFRWGQIENVLDGDKTKAVNGSTGVVKWGQVETVLDGDKGKANNPTVEADDKDTLRHINFSATGPTMVAVVGKVGSGKSTLASAMLGLVSNCGGTVEIGGRTAYVAQQACILNDTVRNNILFGDEYDESRYRKVIEACALGPDIAAFNAGDQTEIGEKGITISGGQRQRISVARAAYSRTEIVIFDDPLSAMDAHVGRIVFEKCLKGWMRDRTRIFFTNQLQYCEDCQEIFVLEDGEIVERGSFQVLNSRPDSSFAALYGHIAGDGDDGTDGGGSNAEKDSSAGPAPKKTSSAVSSSKDRDAADAAAKKKGTSTQAEGKSAGRIGILDFLEIASFAKAPILGPVVVALSLASPVAQYGVSFYLAKWTESDNLQSQTDIQNYLIAAGVFALLVLSRALSYAFFFLATSTQLHRRMLTSVLRNSMLWFDTTPVGRVLVRFGADVYALDVVLPRLFEYFTFLAGTCFVVIVLAGIFNPWLLIAISIILIGMSQVYKYYGLVALDMQRLNLMANGPVLASFSGFLGGLETIRAFNKSEAFIQRFVAHQRCFLKVGYQSFTLDRACQALTVNLFISTFIFFLGMVILWYVPSILPFLLSSST
jgi:ABC-type multidrug transport system fused ATPase/permease subunit